MAEVIHRIKTPSDQQNCRKSESKKQELLTNLRVEVGTGPTRFCFYTLDGALLVTKKGFNGYIRAKKRGKS